MDLWDGYCLKLMLLLLIVCRYENNVEIGCVCERGELFLWLGDLGGE